MFLYLWRETETVRGAGRKDALAADAETACVAAASLVVISLQVFTGRGLCQIQPQLRPQEPGPTGPTAR